MRKLRHALSGAIYESEKPGFVRVEQDGVAGIFSQDGVWVSGELQSVDPHLCNWVGGRTDPSNGPPRRAMRHFSGALYEINEDGLIRVNDFGSEGIFRLDGSWVSGELQHADPAMCKWVGSYQED